MSARLASTFLLVLAAGLVTVEARAQDVSDRFGVSVTTLSLREARAAAFDGGGWLYLLGASRIEVFDADLRPVGGWGRRGGAAGQLRQPGGLAVARDGTLYVADTGNHQIQVFGQDGTWKERWGERGAGESGLLRPRGVVLGLDERRLFVTDEGNDRLQVFELPSGRPLASWNGADEGGADGLLSPAGLARDETGRLFVADQGNHRVMVFDASGQRLATLGERGPFPGLFASPAGLACHAGRLYVADRENHRIQVFSIDALLEGQGEPLYEWGKHAIRPREGEGRLHYPDTLAIAPDGSRAVVCEAFVDRAQVFGPATGSADVYAADPTLRSGIAPHYGPAVAQHDGLLLLTEPESQSIQVLAIGAPTRTAPVLMHRMGDWGTGFGKNLRLADVTFGFGLALSTDRDARRIQCWRLDEPPAGEPVFVPDLGHLVRAVDLPGVLAWGGMQRAEGEPLARPGALVANAEQLFVVDEATPRVIALDQDWKPVQEIARGDLHTPVDLAWGPFDAVSASGDGALYVADAALSTVFIYAPTPSRSASQPRPLERAGVLTDGLREPAGVAVDDAGRVYVTDRELHAVLVYGPDGSFLRRWGSEGLAAGQFFKPRGIAVLEDGRVLVVDHGNHRCQLFTSEGVFLDAFGSRLYVEAARRGGAEWLEEER